MDLSQGYDIACLENSTYLYTDIPAFQNPIRIPYKKHKMLVVEKTLQQIYVRLFRVA